MEQFMELFKNHKNLHEVKDDMILLRIPDGYYAYDMEFLFWEKEGNLFRFEVKITRYAKLSFQSDRPVFRLNGVDYAYNNGFSDFNLLLLDKFLMTEEYIKDFLSSNIGKWICNFIAHLNKKLLREIYNTTLGCSF